MKLQLPLDAIREEFFWQKEAFINASSLNRKLKGMRSAFVFQGHVYFSAGGGENMNFRQDKGLLLLYLGAILFLNTLLL